jgi:predicted RNA-binding Zn ribbon-like protein
LIAPSEGCVKVYREKTMLYDDAVSTPVTDAPPPLDDDTPVELRGLINFLNSRASARRPERFDTAANAAAFLAHCELGYDKQALTAPDTTRLRRLRDAVMSALLDASDTSAWDAINGLSATAPLRLETAPGPAVSLQATRTNPADAIIARVLDQLVTAIATGRWARLGACARCQRVFYDNTRSHTRRWCSYATCGNRANVSAYRQRTQQ